MGDTKCSTISSVETLPIALKAYALIIVVSESYESSDKAFTVSSANYFDY